MYNQENDTQDEQQKLNSARILPLMPAINAFSLFSTLLFRGRTMPFGPADPERSGSASSAALNGIKERINRMSTALQATSETSPTALIAEEPAAAIFPEAAPVAVIPETISGMETPEAQHSDEEPDTATPSKAQGMVYHLKHTKNNMSLN